MAALRDTVRGQRCALRRARRLIEEQQAELCRLVNVAVKAAATG